MLIYEFWYDYVNPIVLCKAIIVCIKTDIFVKILQKMLILDLMLQIIN